MTNGARQATIVDTNVAVVANGSDDVGPDCVRCCAAALQKLTKSGRVAIDDEWEILKEYNANSSTAGQPVPGGVFLKWLLTNRENLERCIQVSITPTGGYGEDYAEFPRDEALNQFDLADRKFVAVAIAVDGPATILQAVDTRWWGLRYALLAAGVDVSYLCEEEISRKHGERMQRT